jgi:hypothetical protein
LAGLKITASSKLSECSKWKPGDELHEKLVGKGNTGISEETGVTTAGLGSECDSEGKVEEDANVGLTADAENDKENKEAEADANANRAAHEDNTDKEESKCDEPEEPSVPEEAPEQPKKKARAPRKNGKQDAEEVNEPCPAKVPKAKQRRREPAKKTAKTPRHFTNCFLFCRFIVN